MNTRIPANTVPAALRELLTLILLDLRKDVPWLVASFVWFVIAGAWAAFLIFTGLADALGRMAPW